MTSKGRIWITRTQPGADQSAKLWRAAGWSPVIAPLLRISAPETRPPKPDDDAALVFTSANGVRAFAKLFDARDNPVFTVGDTTARAARLAGFSDVLSAQGRANDVAPIVMKALPTSRPVIHCAGRHVRGSVSEDLQAAGYRARRDLYYQSAPVESLPALTPRALRAVALYSPLAAQTLKSFDLDLSQARMICISVATAGALGARATGPHLIAATPDEPAMLALAAQMD